MPSTDDFTDELELIPVAGDQLASDAALDLAAEALLGAQAAVSEVAEEAAYGRSWHFDYAEGQFLRYGAGPAITTGLDTLRGWIEKTIHTSRFAYEIYSDQYGLDDVDMIGAPFSAEVLSALGRAIEEALLVHDRIAQVTNMTFERPDEDDYVLVSFTVVTDTDDTFPLDIPVVP
jgi:hypothetical protein